MTMFCKPGAQRAVIAALEDIGAEHIPYSIDMDGLNVRVREKSTHALRTTLAGVPTGSSAWQPVPQ